MKGLSTGSSFALSLRCHRILCRLCKLPQSTEGLLPIVSNSENRFRFQTQSYHAAIKEVLPGVGRIVNNKPPVTSIHVGGASHLDKLLIGIQWGQSDVTLYSQHERRATTHFSRNRWLEINGPGEKDDNVK